MPNVNLLLIEICNYKFITKFDIVFIVIVKVIQW